MKRTTIRENENCNVIVAQVLNVKIDRKYITYQKKVVLAIHTVKWHTREEDGKETSARGWVEVGTKRTSARDHTDLVILNVQIADCRLADSRNSELSGSIPVAILRNTRHFQRIKT